MNTALPLDKMSLSEKLKVMEELWTDLSRDSSGYSPPDWHEGVLEERKRQYQAGEIGSMDWDDAKEKIRNEI